MKKEIEKMTVKQIKEDHDVVLSFNGERLADDEVVWLDYGCGNYYRNATRVSRTGNDFEYEELLDVE